VLSLFEFDVVGVAATVSDALCLAQNTHPDLVIFDVRLAGKQDGIEGARLLRQIMDIPVVFLTGQGDRETRARAQFVNPAAYLVKPVSPARIFSAVEAALQRVTNATPGKYGQRSTESPRRRLS
jgi:DNA-binding NarL/FixJ family response regulator